MAAVGSVWATGSWSDVPWEANTWANAVAKVTLFTEGAYYLVPLGGGVYQIIPASPRLEVDLTTGHVGEIT